LRSNLPGDARRRRLARRTSSDLRGVAEPKGEIALPRRARRLSDSFWRAPPRRLTPSSRQIRSAASPPTRQFATASTTEDRCKRNRGARQSAWRFHARQVGQRGARISGAAQRRSAHVAAPRRGRERQGGRNGEI
jgi:hypothetical protein